MRGLADRGQSGVDFVIGFGVFFVTLSFVITVVPELLAPFAGLEGPLVADRAVETLSGDLLVGGTVGTLDEGCTAAFFDGRDSTCVDGSESMASLVGVSERHRLNVTLEESGQARSEVLCYDGDDVVSCDSGGSPATRGGPPPTSTASVHTASRVVRVDGRTVWLKLRTW